MTTRRRPPARQLLTPQSEQILATLYPGQVRAAVIERALRRMAAADQRADCEPDWDEDHDQLLIPPDLKGQHLTADQYLTLTDIHPTGEYL